MPYINSLIPDLPKLLIAVSNQAMADVEDTAAAIAAAVLDRESRSELFGMIVKTKVGLLASTLRVEDSVYDSILDEGPSRLRDRSLSKILLSPTLLTMLAQDLEDELPESWWDAVEQLGAYRSSMVATLAPRSVTSNAASMPYSMAAGSVQNTVDDLYAGLFFSVTDPCVAYWGGTDAIVASNTGTIFLWISEEDQLVQVQLRSTSGAFAPMEGDFARVITCESTVTLDAMIARFKQTGSQIDQAGCTDGMIEVLVRQFAFGRGNRLGLELSRLSPQGEREVRFIVMFTPTIV
jgi:hypothetical protein